jgi:hypothetical protein
MRRICLLLLALACSSSGGPGGGGTLAGYKPCDPASRVGGFTLELVPPDPSVSKPGTAQVAGSIQNGVDASQLWVAQASEGDCKLLGLPIPFCDPACGSDKPICTAQNKCIAEPMPQDVGTVTLGGLASPATAMKTGAKYYSPINMPYPPYGPDAEIELRASGGVYKPFTLHGRGIAPLGFTGTGVKVFRNQPLAVHWTPPVDSSYDRIVISLDIGHHGGIAARIECDVADSGSTTIPTTLINKLLDKGTAGFPSINVKRRTVDSTTVGAGCADFVVASPVEAVIEVDGVVSCNDNDLPCPGGKVCGRDYKCQ